jgi:hypothetical protein
LLVSGPAIWWLSLSGRCFRGGTVSVGREEHGSGAQRHALKALNLLAKPQDGG